MKNTFNNKEINLLQVALTHMKEHLEEISGETETSKRLKVCKKLIKDFNKQQGEELKHIYIHETHSMWQDFGELHLLNDTQHIVINCDTFFNDLPHIINLVIQGRESQNKLIIESLKDTLKDLK